jgi:hypothetical protein
MGEERNACSVLVGKPKGKIAVGRIKHKWNANIKQEVLGRTNHLLSFCTTRTA